jgi:hypothetical protein
MKKKYELYEMNSDVYAISENNTKGSENHFAILPVRIRTGYVEFNSQTNKIDISYWLSDRNGVEWEESISADKVSDSFDELVAKCKLIWDKHPS